MRCRRCGSENAEGNRFCGMCGAALEVKDQAAQSSHVSGATSVGGERARAATSADVKADVGPSPAPVITGPSFLGLGTPVGGTGSERGDHHSGGHDALRPSSNVDYLLEDVEEPRRSRGKVILIVMALALAVGFGYLHWKRGGFDWLSAGEKKPSAATTPEAGQGAADSAAKETAAPSGATPQSGTGAAPAAGAASPAESGAAPVTPSQSSSAAPSQNPANVPAQTTTPQSAEQQSASQGSAGDSSAAASTPQAGETDSEKQMTAAEETPKPARKPAAEETRKAHRKPAAARIAAAKPAAAKPTAAKADVVTEAERYIYGQGAVQDCERGLRLLKPAAEQANVKAMTSLGVLYSTGTCTPRDLPTAYRWFALALHKEPDSQSLQNDLQNLWSTMTPPERQLAIKLSQ